MKTTEQKNQEQIENTKKILENSSKTVDSNKQLIGEVAAQLEYTYLILNK